MGASASEKMLKSPKRPKQIFCRIHHPLGIKQEGFYFEIFFGHAPCRDPIIGHESLTLSFSLHCLAKGVFSPIPPYRGYFVPSHFHYHVVNPRLSRCNFYEYLEPVSFHCSICSPNDST